MIALPGFCFQQSGWTGLLSVAEHRNCFSKALDQLNLAFLQSCFSPFALSCVWIAVDYSQRMD